MRPCLVIVLVILIGIVNACAPPAQHRTPPPPPPEEMEAARPSRSRVEGSNCRSGAECQSGVCEGEGCGATDEGICVPAQRACTRDLATYCGCDGKEFRTSGSCPGRRYANRGPCQ